MPLRSLQREAALHSGLCVSVQQQFKMHQDTTCGIADLNKSGHVLMSAPVAELCLHAQRSCEPHVQSLFARCWGERATLEAASHRGSCCGCRSIATTSGLHLPGGKAASFPGTFPFSPGSEAALGVCGFQEDHHALLRTR